MPTSLHANILYAVQKLQAGEIVALPTETVYGLAVDANNPKAITKLYNLKHRSQQKPMAIAIASPQDAHYWVDELSEDAKILIKSFWPGPLTLVLPAASHVSPLINAGHKTIGIRCSSSKMLQEIILLLGNAICLTSANLSGQPEAQTASQIRSVFQDNIFICEDDKSMQGRPSTIVDLTVSPYKILRETTISSEDIQKKINNTKLANK